VVHILKSDEGESIERTGEPIFGGGQVFARRLLPEGQSRDFDATLVQFGPGARTRLHRHTSDQVLYVVSGIGKVGDPSGERVVSAGDTALIPHDTDHWHGAADTTSPMSHISFLSRDNQTTLSE
jgi:quercetin dioxygenase-like cupin family protein